MFTTKFNYSLSILCCFTYKLIKSNSHVNYLVKLVELKNFGWRLTSNLCTVDTACVFAIARHELMFTTSLTMHVASVTVLEVARDTVDSVTFTLVTISGSVTRDRLPCYWLCCRLISLNQHGACSILQMIVFEVSLRLLMNGRVTEDI